MAKNWKAIVKSVAPTIATALGGPFVGMATKAIGDAVLGDGAASEEQIESALLTPQALESLKSAERQFKAEMKRLDIDIEALAVDDRKNARDLAKTNMMPQISLSALFVFGYFAVLWVLFSGTVTLAENMRDTANILLGVITAGIPMILRFWFGGSLHDREHIDKIYNSHPK